MKKYIKSLVAASVIALVSLTSNAAILATNTTTNGIYQLLTSGAKVSQITVIAGTAVAPLVYFYDANWASTNWSNSAYISVSSYTTNLVTTNVSALSGMTNYWTNTGTFTYTNTVIASITNNLPATIFAGAAVAGSVVTYNPTLLFERGITIQATTNSTLIITYQSLSGN